MFSFIYPFRKSYTMTWFNPFTLSCILVGLTFYLAALITIKFPPKGINQMYGYRTRSSMKSKEHWDFAQGYSNQKMKQLGIFFVVFSPIGVVLNASPEVSIGIFLVIMLGAIIYFIHNVEKSIKQKFGRL